MNLKSCVRKSFARFGYVVRSVENKQSVTGVDLLHDVSILLCDRPQLVLFDVGANVGQTIQSFLETFRQPTIHSFEPSPQTFNTLSRDYGGKPRIHLNNMALGNDSGVLPFHVTKEYSVNDSLLAPTWKAEATVVPVQVQTVDGYCDQHGVTDIDFLKIDTQGFDLNVLRGADRMLKERRVRAFSIELTFHNMYKEQPTPLEALAFVENVGYRLLGFYELTYQDNRLWYCNACFVI